MGLLRLFLALVVALGHYRIGPMTTMGERDAPYIFYLQLGLDAGHAVMLFYIISGFLISYALENKYSVTRHGRYEFYKSRFIRIYPLYWFLSALAIALTGASYFSGRNPLDVLLGIILFGADWRVSFGDYPNQYFGAFPPLLNQAWTLGAELTFYLIAPFLLRSTKVCLAVLAASAIIRAYLVHRYGWHTTWTYTFFPATVMFFLLGHFSRTIYAKLNLGQWNFIFIVPFVVFAWLGLTKSFDSIYFYLYAASMMLFVPPLFEKTKDSMILNFLGDNSYPVYLSHIIVLSLLSSYEIKGIWGAVLFCAACIAFASILHLFVERPFSFALKYVFARRISEPPKSAEGP